MTPPNILFIILDCLRADRFEREAFAALRGSGCHFQRAYTPIATTTPSVATMLTGLYPFEHGIVSLTGYKLREDPLIVLGDHGERLTETVPSPEALPAAAGGRIPAQTLTTSCSPPLI
jgi:arylsulfatase A-like enzyme